MAIDSFGTQFAIYEEFESECGDEFSFEELMAAAENIIKLYKKKTQLDVSHRSPAEPTSYVNRDVFDVVSSDHGSFYCLWREHRSMMYLYE